MANSIIGKQKESALLDELYQSGKTELVAIYGRRRIGKSAPWCSDLEVKIDKSGNAIRNGKPTGRLWDGTIATDDTTLKPLRLKVRNICGDETVVVLDESL